MYQAKIVADSVNLAGVRATTFELVYPRFIHAEVLRHRSLSHCVASSRAIPAGAFAEALKTDPVIPFEWSAKDKGMGTNKLLESDAAIIAKSEWRNACEGAIGASISLDNCGLNKQYVNRVVEPFAWVTDVVTGTDWTGFFLQRSPAFVANTTPEVILARLLEEQEHLSPVFARKLIESAQPKNAQPEIRHLADLVFTAMEKSTPETRIVSPHLPYINDSDRTFDRALDYQTRAESHILPLVAAARCGRASYLRQGDIRPHAEDVEWARARASEMHLSVFEHSLYPEASTTRHQNFRGFQSLRLRMEAGFNPFPTHSQGEKESR